MKLVQAWLLGFVVAASAWAQHGASGGSAVGGHAAGGHSGGGFSSGRSFSMSAPGAVRNLNSAPVYRPNSATQSRSLYNSPIGPPPFGGTQPITGRGRYPYGGYGPYYSRSVYLVPGWRGSGFYGYGYPDDTYYDDQQQSAPAAPDATAQAAPAESGTSYGPPYGYDQAYAPPPPPPYSQQAPPAAQVPDQPAVTLLFKDGRPPQQVRNYALTSTMLYVLDGTRRREILLNQLDLPQTEKTNRDAGIDFQVPSGAE